MLKGKVPSRRLPECPHPNGGNNLKHCVCPLPSLPPEVPPPPRLFQQWLVHIFQFPVNLRPAAAAG